MNEYRTLDDAADDVREWCWRERFDNPQRHMLKLIEEFGEVAECINKDKLDTIAPEIADMFILLVGLSASLHIDLAQAVSDKLAIVFARNNVVRQQLSCL